MHFNTQAIRNNPRITLLAKSKPFKVPKLLLLESICDVERMNMKFTLNKRSLHV